MSSDTSPEAELSVGISVNGQERHDRVPAHWTLLRWLRERVWAYEVKDGCSEGTCGACTVLLDGRAATSCCVLIGRADGAEVTTARGLGEDGQLDELQEQFWSNDAAQCGFCTQGMLMAAQSVVASNNDVDRETIREALHGNLCRCTGYQAIVDAVEKTILSRRR